jgi:hypothetical protein
MLSKIRGEDNAIRVGQEEEHREDGKVRNKGDHDEAREDREIVEQRVTADHRNGAWRNWDVGDTSGREEEESGTISGGEERTAENEDRSTEEKWKRAFGKSEGMVNSTPEERLNKRSKSDRRENEDDAATEDSFE